MRSWTSNRSGVYHAIKRLTTSNERELIVYPHLPFVFQRGSRNLDVSSDNARGQRQTSTVPNCASTVKGQTRTSLLFTGVFVPTFQKSHVSSFVQRTPTSRYVSNQRQPFPIAMTSSSQTTAFFSSIHATGTYPYRRMAHRVAMSNRLIPICTQGTC